MNRTDPLATTRPSSRYEHLIDCANRMLHAQPSTIQQILDRWASPTSGTDRMTADLLTRAVASLVDYLDDGGFDVLVRLCGSAVPAHSALLGAAAGLTAAEIEVLDGTGHADLVVLAGLRGYRVG